MKFWFSGKLYSSIRKSYSLMFLYCKLIFFQMTCLFSTGFEYLIDIANSSNNPKYYLSVFLVQLLLLHFYFHIL